MKQGVISENRRKNSVKQLGRVGEGSGRKACGVPNPAWDLILLKLKTRQLIFVSSET